MKSTKFFNTALESGFEVTSFEGASMQKVNMYVESLDEEATVYISFEEMKYYAEQLEMIESYAKETVKLEFADSYKSIDEMDWFQDLSYDRKEEIIVEAIKSNIEDARIVDWRSTRSTHGMDSIMINNDVIVKYAIASLSEKVMAEIVAQKEEAIAA